MPVNTEWTNKQESNDIARLSDILIKGRVLIQYKDVVLPV